MTSFVFVLRDKDIFEGSIELVGVILSNIESFFLRYNLLNDTTPHSFKVLFLSRSSLLKNNNISGSFIP